MPGYTHLQRAQPISFAHHIMTYFWMLERDYTRFADSLKRIDISPLGAAALVALHILSIDIKLKNYLVLNIFMKIVLMQ